MRTMNFNKPNTPQSRARQEADWVSSANTFLQYVNSQEQGAADRSPKMVARNVHHAERGGTNRRGFSLVEMLFAIFILGIGVISIAALFPVGLTQQRRSADAIIGPTIANNAIEVIRSKVKPDFFGYLNTSVADDPYVTIPGDFRWRRPAYYTSDTTSAPYFGQSRQISAGSINLFDDLTLSGDGTETELPFNTNHIHGVGPTVVITQEERYFPQQSHEMIAAGTATLEVPQYMWDCMFRRFQGKVMVAIFVYRATVVGGEPSAFRVRFQNPNDPDRPPMPHYNLLDGSTVADGQWNQNLDGDGNVGETVDDAIIPGTFPGDAFSPAVFDDSWQARGQWILDQNNTMHRVLSGRRNMSDGPVQLQRPVYEVRGGRDAFSQDPLTDDPVFELWYVPSVVVDPVTGIEYRLDPIYATVKEL